MVKQQRSRTFLCVLYPDCFEHQKMMSYLTQMSGIFEWVRILHDKDKLDSIDPDKKTLSTGQEYKKAHYHYMIRFKDARTLRSTEKFFYVWCKHFEICSSIPASLMYMIHQTPECFETGKTPYSVEQLEGSSRLISMLGLNANLVQLSEVLHALRSCDGNVTDLITSVADENPVYGELMLQTMQTYQGIFVCAARQEFLVSQRRCNCEKDI